MRISTGFFLGAVLVVGTLAFGGCDDTDSTNPKDQHEANATARPGTSGATASGWIAVSTQRASIWHFTRLLTPLPGSQLVTSGPDAPTTQPADEMFNDPLVGIRIAIGANMLPSRDSVRAPDMVNRALQSADPPTVEAPSAQPIAILTSTPWSDDTLLLWVAVPSLIVTDKTTVSVEFDPKTVATFRALGDPATLPFPAAIPGWFGRAAMLYELSPQPDSTQARSAAGLKYGIVHITGTSTAEPRIDRAISTADIVGGIDSAPDPVQFAAAVAGFGGLLRGDPALRDLSCNDMIALAEGAALPDPDGWHGQMIALMRRAEPLIDLPPR